MNAQSPGLFSKLSRRVSAAGVVGAEPFSAARARLMCQSFESLGLGALWITDAEGGLVYLSDAAAALLLGDGDYRGIPLCDLFNSVEEADTARSLRLLLARRSRFERLTLQSGEDEAACWWSLSGEALFDERGQFSGFHGFCSDITRDRRVAEENSQLAMHDALTGLLNRRRMTQVLERTLAVCRSQDRACATMLIDLDHFKQINDTLGHSTGDALLRQVAERLVTIVGDRNNVCRLGGDEFQVLLAGEDDRGKLGELAERIIAMVSQPYTIDGKRCIIGASIGVAVSPFDGQSLDELVRNADLALYAAKHGGRGRFRFFTQELLEAAEQRRVLEQDLHDALGRGEFELLYQPVVKTETNRVSGAEALIRWNHREKGVVSPALFIPIAEESSLICRIGEWILRKGCEEAAQWPAPLRIAINVSPVQFNEPAFPERVARALASSGLAPDRLELEITEGVFLADGAATDAIFHALKTLGVRLALDDFGTGYSSLAYLKSAPFDKIKIDQSFVRGATEEGSRNKAIIAAIVSLAGALGMETTAEGIETFDQLAMIREQGVSHIQGYIYSKPISNEEFARQAQHADWGIEPSGYAVQRYERVTTYRNIGAIHEDYYYTVILRNLSETGALIEGLSDVPAGTQFVLDFGEGQLEIATVKRSMGHKQGVAFERKLVRDGNGGLYTRSRISPLLLAEAGLPIHAAASSGQPVIGVKGARISVPMFMSALERRSITAGRRRG